MMDKLSFDEQIDYAVILNELKKLNPEEQKDLMDTLRSDLESYKVYLKMDNIADLIDTFFGDNEGSIMQLRPEVIEEEIAKLPEYHLLHVEDQKVNQIYKNYCSKLYKFMLYENINDRKKLFKKYEVRSIVVNEAINDLKELELKEDMPNEIYSIIYSCKYNKNYTPEITTDVLKYLYAIKNNTKLVNYDEKLETTKNEKTELEGKLSVVNKDLKKKRVKLYNAVGFGVGIPTAVFVGSFAGFNSTFVRSLLYNYNQSITSETPNGVKSIDSGVVGSYLSQNIINEFMNTERKFVTVFGDTNDGMVEVKVYDYTGTNLSDNDLKTIELDDSKIIYSEVLQTEKIKMYTQKKVYGLYTGEAHRDISIVNFSVEKMDAIETVMVYILFLMLALIVACLPIAFSYEILSTIDVKGLYEDIKELKEKRKPTLEEYEKVLNKIKKLKEQIDLEKKKKEVIGNTTVEKELEDNRPVGFRI